MGAMQAPSPVPRGDAEPREGRSHTCRCCRAEEGKQKGWGRELEK